MLLLRDLVRQIRYWDAPSRISLALAVVFLLIAVLIAVFGPENLRMPVMVIIIGLIVVTQAIIMWGNRGLVTPYTEAQRYYLAGEFEKTCAVLGAAVENEKANAQMLTLLGNAYRQLGQLSDSEAVLHRAIELEPQSHFAAYGLGMTLMAQGHYDEAIVMIRQSLSYGAPTVVQFDLGHCLYRLGDAAEAAKALNASLNAVAEEPHRLLMRAYILSCLGEGNRPDAHQVEAGIAFWKASAERFQSTAYGQILQHDVQQMQQWTEEV